jgi:hypothetical protein
MKETRDLYYLAALADNEINDSAQIEKLKSAIEKNPDMKAEYDVQMLIKSLVSDKLKTTPAPDKMKRKIERKLRRMSRAGRPDRNL